MFSKLSFLASIALCAEPNPPSWDTDKVKIFSPGDGNAQQVLDSIHATQGGMDPPQNGKWSDKRYALFFKPGQHNVNVDLGYYTSIYGLGRSPWDTTLDNLQVLNGGHEYTLGALTNFWRSAENVHVKPSGGKMTWAVSQAAPLRRTMVEGDLDLFHQEQGQPAGYASGGFMADVLVTGKLDSGSQQQYLFRNTEMGQWAGGALGWNMVFVGSKNAPADHCGKDDGQTPSTNVRETPVIIEKPYIVADGDNYKLMVPRVERNKVGISGGQNAQEFDFSKVYVAREQDSAETINRKLDEGLHLILQPGTYNLNAPIVIKNPNTVVMGLGMATLNSANGNSCIEVADVEGVKISGIILQAGTKWSTQLLKWGYNKNAGNPSNPGAMHDVFARVGGPGRDEVHTALMVQINSGNVIIDHAWLWRADQDQNGLVAYGKNPVYLALQVNADHVTGYAIACEHTLDDNLQWNGEYGQVYMFQSEFAYDVTQENYGNKNKYAYKVGDFVQNHQAWGVGAYSYFRDNWVTQSSGIKTPEGPGIKFTNSLALFLAGKGQINNVINNHGQAVNAQHRGSYQCSLDQQHLVNLYYNPVVQQKLASGFQATGANTHASALAPGLSEVLQSYYITADSVPMQRVSLVI